tara:strand:+ start:716 stop:2083 length:1368 start_codon:yes stop_codon:yes gene_type:complete
MKKIFIIIIISICFQVNGQNLIPNPSFENYNTCPTSDGQLINAIPWINSNSDSPDLFNSCVGSNCNTSPWVCVPTNFFGNQLPNTGNGYSGIAVGVGGSIIEYLHVKLLSPLIVGDKYQVSYYISLGDQSTRAIDRIGVYFSSTQISSVTNQLSYTPQIITPPGFYITNKIGWILITDTLTALGGEEYITLGNFNNVSNTNFISGLGGTLDYPYYYIDDLSLIKIGCNPQTIDLGNDTTLCQGGTLTLDATTTNATYLWQDNSTNPTLNVTQQGTYWVQITDSCGSTTGTINVSYYQLLTLDLGNDRTLCQGETLTLDVTTTNATYLWQDNSTNPTLNVTQQGTYWAEVIINNCSEADTIIIIEEDCEIILEMPNVFTPNSDGINDIFVPIISKGIVSMNTIIYNRWGNKIYETNDLLVEWDGQDVSDGVYFWIVNYTDINDVKNNLKGHVTILK